MKSKFDTELLDEFFQHVRTVGAFFEGYEIPMDHVEWLTIYRTGVGGYIIKIAAQQHHLKIEDIIDRILDDMNNLNEMKNKA